MAEKKDDMTAFIEKQRAEVGKKRDALIEKQQEIAGELEHLDKQMAAIRAYEDTLAGKITLSVKATRKPRATGTRKPREGGRREQVLGVIKDAPEGLTRGEILAKMGIVEKDNKQGAQSVSNALTNMKKAGALTQKDGKYVAAKAA